MKVPQARKLSSGNWFIQLRLNGESVPVTAATEKECVKQATLIKAEIQAGKRPKKATGEAMTLREAIDSYIKARSNTLSPSTIGGYHTIKDNRFEGVMDRRIKDIADWQTICNLEAKTCSAKTLRNAWMLVASVLRETTGTAPPKVRLPQVVIRERPYLDPDQIPVFINAIKGKQCEIPALLALHSLRRSEICALTWSNVDLPKKRIKVCGATVLNEDNKFVQKPTNKNQSSHRYVPIMIPELVEALSRCEDKSGLVVTCSPFTIRTQVNKVCVAIGLPKVGTHGLRHSFASLAYHLSVPEKVVMQIGGWSDRETMHKIYTHLAQKDIAKYENEMTEFFKNANAEC